MNRVRAKFTVSNLLKDNWGNVVVKMYAVYKGDETSPENESFSNSTPSGSVELTISNPAASEFFEKLAGKYVYLDFTPEVEADPEPDGNKQPPGPVPPPPWPIDPPPVPATVEPATPQTDDL